MHRPFDIAVVGAGIAGLAAAAMLKSAGHNVIVFERFSTSLPLGSGLMLQPTGLAVLERMGLRQRIEALGHRIERLYGVTDTGAQIFDLAYADLDPAHYAVAVHRALLHGVLWENFKACGAPLETGRTITGFERQLDSRVKLKTNSGVVNGTFDLVIDASGANSALRTFVSAASARQFAYGAVWASIPDIGLAPGCLSQRYVAAREMVGYLPIGRVTDDGPPLAALFWSLKPADYQTWRDNFEHWRDHVVALWPELEPIITRLAGPDDLTLASYTHFTARHPFKGRIVLAGDSAHATSPQLGQGANNGLLDAVALSDAIANQNNLDAALASYAQTRRRHVRFYQMASTVMTPFFQSDSLTFSALRDVIFNRLKLIPYLEREMVRTLAGLKTGPFSHATPAAIAGLKGGSLPVRARSATAEWDNVVS
ncbi:FAD-dependent oxidoreductase [Bradyrhizobium sp. SYSU BS000235]|uniref:FAD-dependent oxidoreductase n=1 Tax=Bradyrhizobium sp. SYSU BS000235 TaxID=3411332 RepID=UPI003C7135EB